MCLPLLVKFDLSVYKFNSLILLAVFPKVDCIDTFQNITLTNLNGAAEQALTYITLTLNSASESKAEECGPLFR